MRYGQIYIFYADALTSVSIEAIENLVSVSSLTLLSVSESLPTILAFLGRLKTFGPRVDGAAAIVCLSDRVQVTANALAIAPLL